MANLPKNKITSLEARARRYPAKMVPKLAHQILDEYFEDAMTVYDPFCGSAEVLLSAASRGLNVMGTDINPYAVLLAQVRVEGFEFDSAVTLLDHVINAASQKTESFEIAWKTKCTWFTPAVLGKLERMRYWAKYFDLPNSPDGRAVLLAITQSIRLCSRADDRSPKPFISKLAKERKGGLHIDPFTLSRNLLGAIRSCTSPSKTTAFEIRHADAVNDNIEWDIDIPIDAVITSPPYANAQDYYRNSKLELYWLEGLLPFTCGQLSDRFIGTERGSLLASVSPCQREEFRARFEILSDIQHRSKKGEQIMLRYLADMNKVFSKVRRSMVDDGKLAVVCGDNVIAGVHVKTSTLLNEIIECAGFKKVHSFRDPIRNRSLAPRRAGHLALIKEEVISIFVCDKTQG